jgi:hypothetical protein
LFTSGLSRTMPPLKSVAMAPGATALTAILRGANSLARYLVSTSKPPVHLPLGSDTLAAYREKAANFDKEIAEWHDVITGTDHDDVAKIK